MRGATGKLRGLVFLLSLWAFGGFCGTAFGQAADDYTVHILKRMQFRLIPDVTELVPYEPLPFSLELHNPTDRDVDVPADFFSYVTVYIARGNGPFALRARTFTGACISGTSTIRSRQSLRSSELLFWGAVKGHGPRTFLFPKEGTYRVKVTAGIETNTVKIRVVHPSPDEVAAAAIVRQEAAAGLLQRIEMSREGSMLLEQLLVQFPDSRFADHVHLALGNYYAHEPTGDLSLPRRHFGSVSKRVHALKVRALYGEATALPVSKDAISRASFEELRDGLDANSDVAKQLNLEPLAGALRGRLHAMEILFVDDARLDAEVRYDFPEFTPYSDVLEVIATRSGVPLDAEESLKRDARMRTIGGSKTTTVRNFMWEQTRESLAWRPQGDGYILVAPPKFPK